MKNLLSSGELIDMWFVMQVQQVGPDAGRRSQCIDDFNPPVRE